MDQDDHLAILRDVQRSVIERIRAGAKCELVIWTRTDKPNLSRAEFERILPLIPKVPVKWAKRDSTNGKYGLSGEDEVFEFEFSLNFGRNVNLYYVKGYFFEKHELKGVEIQSFRLERTYRKRGGLRIV